MKYCHCAMCKLWQADSSLATWFPLTAQQMAAQRDALLSVTAALVAAIDLLKHGGKKAAPSDKMLRQMLRDYEVCAVKARSVLNTATEGAKRP